MVAEVKLRELALPLGLLIVGRLFFYAVIPNCSEDSYITFRYANNLAHGSGLVFNAHERVMGITSPLWALWSAVGLWLGVPIEWWSRGTSFFADGYTLILVAEMLPLKPALIFATLFAGIPYFANLSASGLEMSAMLALMATAASTRNGFALGALAFIRPEGLLMAAILSWRAKYKARLIGAGIALVGWGSMWAYYGSPIPHSVTAKLAMYGSRPFAKEWWDWAMPFVIGHFASKVDSLVLVMLAVVLSAAAVVGISKTRGTAGSLLLASGVVWTAFLFSGPACFWWYLSVPMFGLLIAASMGMPFVLKGHAVYVAGVLCLLGLWTYIPKAYAARSIAESEAATVLGLKPKLNVPGQTVMTEPIGILGYRFPVRVIDESGIVSPEVLSRRVFGEPGWYADIVVQEHPDWLVGRKVTLQDGGGFAGVGAPFRSKTEMVQVLSHYRLVSAYSRDMGPNDICAMRRID